MNGTQPLDTRRYNKPTLLTYLIAIVATKVVTLQRGCLATHFCPLTVLRRVPFSLSLTCTSESRYMELESAGE